MAISLRSATVRALSLPGRLNVMYRTSPATCDSTAGMWSPLPLAAGYGTHGPRPRSAGWNGGAALIPAGRQHAHFQIVWLHFIAAVPAHQRGIEVVAAGMLEQRGW